MKRRTFLQTAVTSAAVSTRLGGYHAFGGPREPSDNPVLVVIYLRGGQDQLNTIIPYNDPRYYQIRPRIAVPKKKVIALDDQWGLHPAMAPLKPFYDERRFALVVNSGSPHSTRSHFDAQDNMEYAAPGNRSLRDGWLNRYLSATAVGEPSARRADAPRALAMQELLPRSLRGAYAVPAVPMNLEKLQPVVDLFENFYTADEPREMVERPGRNSGTRPSAPADPVMASGSETVHTLRALRRLLREAPNSPTGGETSPAAAAATYPDGPFAQRLQALARIIKARVGLEVAAADVGGWDHHVRLGSDDGVLNRMLSTLCQGLAAFMDDLGSHQERTVILLCTEFGRVCKENGNEGADHGHGGAMWLLGGKLRGGRILGDWAGLEAGALHEKRDLPVTTDFRAVFADVLREHMKFDVPATFFPNYRLPRASSGLFG